MARRREPDGPDIDAVAGRYAIEHTLIESFPGQSEDTSFYKSLGGLEGELTLAYRLFISVPVGALKRGTDWSAIVDPVRNWILEDSAALPAGHRRVSVHGVPFELGVWREDDSWGRGLFFARHDPGDTGFVAMVKAQAARKIEKLVRYQNGGLPPSSS